MAEILTRTVPARWMRHVSGEASYALDGTLTLKWIPDDPFAVHLHADLPTFTVDSVVDISVFHVSMTECANGKFTHMTAGSPVGIAYSSPGLFGVKLDLADGSRLIGSVAPFAVPMVAAFHHTMSTTVDNGSEMIGEIVDAELEMLIRGYSKSFEEPGNEPTPDA